MGIPLKLFVMPKLHLLTNQITAVDNSYCRLIYIFYCMFKKCF
ncbi:hypothetical protein VAE122_3040007 [Vibrio aestuarianus]|nr:hypothetical protein VAE122_3040007 [Vibrio aestuarianus]